MIAILRASSRALCLLFGVVVLVTACSSGADSDNGDERSSDAEPTVGTVASTVSTTTPAPPTAPGTITIPPLVTGPPNKAGLLNENRTKWDRERPDRYTFTYEVQCECPPYVAGPFTVTVEDDEIVETQVPPEAAGGEVTPAFVTIDGLFDLIDQSLGELARVEVTYDPTYGYPTQIVLGEERTAAETDQTYEISGFTPG